MRNSRLSGRRDPVDAGERVLERAPLVGPELRVAEARSEWRDLEQVGAGGVVERERLEREWVEAEGPGLLGTQGRRPTDVDELAGEPLAGRPGLRVRTIGPLEHPEQLRRSQTQGEPALAFRGKRNHLAYGSQGPLQHGIGRSLGVHLA